MFSSSTDEKYVDTLITRGRLAVQCECNICLFACTMRMLLRMRRLQQRLVMIVCWMIRGRYCIHRFLSPASQEYFGLLKLAAVRDRGS